MFGSRILTEQTDFLKHVSDFRFKHGAGLIFFQARHNSKQPGKQMRKQHNRSDVSLLLVEGIQFCTGPHQWRHRFI
jgi:hypothetical protein